MRIRLRVKTVFGEQCQRLSEGWGELKAATRRLLSGAVRSNFLSPLFTQTSLTQTQRKVRHGLALEETCVAPVLDADRENVKIGPGDLAGSGAQVVETKEPRDFNHMTDKIHYLW